MAAIAHQDAESYLQKPSKEHFVFLVFGADQGLIFERSRKLIRMAIGDSRSSLQLTELSGDAIAGDPLLLIDDANSINMFGGSARAIRVSIGGKSILPALDMIAQAPPSDCAIVIEAGDLRRDAPLRKWVEAQRFGASIECRADDARDLQRLVESELKAANLGIEPDAREALTALLGEDRLSTRSELEKLILYAQGQQIIRIDHVRDIGYDASTSTVDAIIQAVSAGDTARTLEHVGRALQQGVDANAMIALTLRYFLAMHRARAEIDGGSRFDDVLQPLLRQVGGYGRKHEIGNSLKNTPLPKLAALVEALSDTNKGIRQNSYLATERVTRMFLYLATVIRRK